MSYTAIKVFSSCSGTEEVISNDSYNGNYIQDFTEWQNHQYDSGYYTGGKIPPFLTNPGKPKLLGWSYIISGISLLFLFFLALAVGYNTRDLIAIIPGCILWGGICLLLIYIGIKYIKSNPINRSNTQKIKLIKKWVCFLITLCLIIGSLIITDKLTEQDQSITINDYFKNNNKPLFYQRNRFFETRIYSIYLAELNRTIKCSEDDYNRVSSSIWSTIDNSKGVIIT